MTIHNMINSTSSSASMRYTKDQMDELKNKKKNGEITAEDYKKQMDGIKDEFLNNKMDAIANSPGMSIFSYMNDTDYYGGGSNNSFGDGISMDSMIFTNAGSQLSHMKALNSARIGIENRARVLSGEIARDKARGYDVTHKQEALGNLTANVSVLNNNLSNNIDRALSNNGTSSNREYTNIVQKLRDSLSDKKEEDAVVETPETAVENGVTPANV